MAELTMCDYVNSFDPEAKLAKIESIINGLENLILERTDSNGVLRYQLNDGQTVVWTTYESIESLNGSIKFWENKLARLRRSLCGNITYMIPGNL